MSLWAKVQNLSSSSIQKIHGLYGEHFPVEVRYVLAAWIEERMFPGGSSGSDSPTGLSAGIEGGNLDPDNPYHETHINQLITALIQELETKAASMANEDPYLIRVKLINAAQNFRHRATVDPISLYRYLRHCLNVEQSLVDQEQGPSSLMGGTGNPLGGSAMDSGFSGMNMDSLEPLGESSGIFIAQKLTQIKHNTMETADIIRRMEQEQEAFAIKCHDRQKLEGIIHLHRMQNQNTSTLQTQALEKNFQEQKQRLEYELKQKITTLMGLKSDLEEKITITVTELSQLQSKVLDDELTRWKREQQLAGNGSPLSNSLDTLQNWCEDLAELIWHNRHQLKEAERLKHNIPVLSQMSATNNGQAVMPDRLASLQEKVTQLLSSLVTSTFIVEKQPPQVMKTNTRFTATVRLLVGGKLNVHMTPPQVKVAIISEAQANALLRQDKGDKPCDTSGEILNNTGTMEYHSGTKHLSVHFRNMQLKRIKRAEKKGTESVMDEKFCLHFQCQFTVGEKELIFKIWTLSLPVVVIVHGNQEPDAWATVTWDNAFGEPGRLPFQVPDRVSWSKVAQALNVKFKSMTGRHLTNDNLRFLAEKALRSQSVTNDEELLSWSAFCKEPLQDRSFTFWGWLYAIIKLTREHLRGPWVDGSIIGFMSKTQAEELLSQRPNGTFLLRFSDSELGGITIAWTHSDGKVFSLAPFVSKDLSTRSLADRVSDLNHLVTLYPDIPKHTAFAKYYTPLQPSKPDKGYVKPQLKTHIPGLGSGEDLDMSCGPGSPYGPDTPQAGAFYNVQSPGSTCSTNTTLDQDHSNSGFGMHGNENQFYSSNSQPGANNRLQQVNSI